MQRPFVVFIFQRYFHPSRFNVISVFDLTVNSFFVYLSFITSVPSKFVPSILTVDSVAQLKVKLTSSVLR